MMIYRETFGLARLLLVGIIDGGLKFRRHREHFYEHWHARSPGRAFDREAARLRFASVIALRRNGSNFNVSPRARWRNERGGKKDSRNGNALHFLHGEFRTGPGDPPSLI